VNECEIVVRHDAELDAFGYFEFLHDRNPAAALRFLQSLDRTVENLARNPLIGRRRRFRNQDLRHIRSWRVEGFENYLIFYRVTEDQLEVLRIRHGAMKFPRALRR
jgi:toxin ParE1/3/4